MTKGGKKHCFRKGKIFTDDIIFCVNTDTICEKPPRMNELVQENSRYKINVQKSIVLLL